MNILKILAIVIVVSVAPRAGAVSMNFSGSFRAEGNYLGNLGLGLPNLNPSKTYLSARALLQPDLVIDDHFTLHSQWNLLTSPTFVPNAGSGNALGVGQGGYVFGDIASTALVLNRAWLAWTSDFGVMRIGRMPVGWGYGLVYDEGNAIWDNFQTTFDRMEYRLHLGNIMGGLSYSKGRKGSTAGSENDQEFYGVFAKYENPEMDIEVGVLYEKQERSSGQEAALKAQPDTIGLPSSTTLGGAGGYTSNPYPLSNSFLDIYFKKGLGHLNFGAELGWINGTAADFAGNGADALDALGVMARTSYEFHQMKAFLEVVYASGDNDLTANHLNGFVLLNRNRRPGIILGQELLGQYHNGKTAGHGSLVAYGQNGTTFSGLIYVRPGFQIEWSQAWSTGLEVIWAQKARVAGAESPALGVEVDLGADYAVYRNFHLGATLGYLFAGQGLMPVGGAAPQGAYGFRTTAAVQF